MEENKMTEETTLTNEQILAYVTAYIKTWNKTEAYLAVHPDCERPSAMSNTYRYWNLPAVQATLAVIMDDYLMGVDEIRAILSQMARGENGVNKANQLKALELIMKSKGMFIDRVDVTTTGQKISWEQIINAPEAHKDYTGGTTILGV